MPIVKERCEGCGKRENVCPECGSYKVTPLDNPGTPKPTKIASHGGPDEQEYTNVCWNCGWKENVTVTFEREKVS